jgi:methyl-accepting chemotaxis protein
MTIAHRLTLLLALPIVVLIGLGVFVANRFDRIALQSRFVAGTQIASVIQLATISRSVTALRVDIRNYLLAEDKGAQAESEKLYRQFEKDLERQLAVYGDTLISDSKDQRFLDEFQNLQHEWQRSADQIFALIAEGRRPEASRQTVSGRFFQTGRQLNDLLVKWSDYNGEVAANAGKTTTTITEQSERQLLIIIGLITMISAVLGYVMLRSVVRPIRALQTSVESIAGGGLHLKHTLHLGDR